MEGFRRISTVELESSMKLIGDDWMLITVKDEENQRANAMTASWGALGVLWHKDVCICYVRPQRHTYKLLSEQQRFSVAFLPEEYRDALKLCGTKSGRDVDKLTECGLHTLEEDGVPMIREASILLVCKKLYEDELKEDCFLESEVMATYRAKDYHTFYICEIEEVYERI